MTFDQLTSVVSGLRIIQPNACIRMKCTVWVRTRITDIPNSHGTLRSAEIVWRHGHQESQFYVNYEDAAPSAVHRLVNDESWSWHGGKPK